MKKLWVFWKKNIKTENNNSALVQKIEQYYLQWAHVDANKCFFSIWILFLAMLTYK